MCGIVAIYNKDIKLDKDMRSKSLSMSKKVRHRGPDWSGIYTSDNAILAHERLSIVDVKSGKQPILSNNEEIILAVNGEIYNQYALTAAHKTLPLPSAVKVTNLKNNKSIILRINDRGPFVNDRIIDLSSKAADILDLKRKGTGLVRVQILREKSLYLEKLAKQGSFPEINDLKETELPNIKIPNKAAVKIKDTKNQKIVTKKINYNFKNLNKEYKIYIKLANFM